MSDNPHFAKVAEIECVVSQWIKDPACIDPVLACDMFGYTQQAILTPETMQRALLACQLIKQLITKQRAIEAEEMQHTKQFKRFLAKQRLDVETFTQQIDREMTQFEKAQQQERQERVPQLAQTTKTDGVEEEIVRLQKETFSKIARLTDKHFPKKTDRHFGAITSSAAPKHTLMSTVITAKAADANPEVLNKIVRLSKRHYLVDDFLTLSSGLEADQVKLKCEDALDAFHAKQACDLKNFNTSIRFSQRQFQEYTRLLVIHEKNKWQEQCDAAAQKLKALKRMRKRMGLPKLSCCHHPLGLSLLNIDEQTIADSMATLQTL